MRDTIEGFMRNVSCRDISGTIVSLISPHAGYMYSGQVAAYAYQVVRNRHYDAVIVVAPSHRAAFRGISFYDGEAYETPLGLVTVDTLLTDRIREKSRCEVSPSDCHDREHAIEIQLPFLQISLEGLQIVPILMGQQDRSTCEALVHAIVQASTGKQVLLVASSDLSHYHPYGEAVRMDSAILKYVERGDSEGLLQAVQQGEAEACGAGPMTVALMVACHLGARETVVLKYLNSGDVTGDKSGVVGYAAAACFTGKEQ